MSVWDTQVQCEEVYTDEEFERLMMEGESDTLNSAQAGDTGNKLSARLNNGLRHVREYLRSMGLGKNV